MALEGFKKNVGKFCDGVEKTVKMRVHDLSDAKLMEYVEKGNHIAVEEAKRRELIPRDDY